MFNGNPTGNALTQDNARVIRENRAAMAGYGDESGTCGKVQLKGKLVQILAKNGFSLIWNARRA